MRQRQRKKEVVEDYLRGGVSLRELEAKYRIDFRTIHRWVKKAEAEIEPEELARARERRALVVKQRDLPVEVNELRKELEKAQLKNELLQAMIEIAEDQFGIEIRKKPGAKQ
jgi:transposase-like protein